MHLSDPYLLRLLIEEKHERRLREAEDARLARSISGSAPRRRLLSHLGDRLLLRPAWHARRPRLNA